MFIDCIVLFVMHNKLWRQLIVDTTESSVEGKEKTRESNLPQAVGTGVMASFTCVLLYTSYISTTISRDANCCDVDVVSFLCLTILINKVVCI